MAANNPDFLIVEDREQAVPGQHVIYVTNMTLSGFEGIALPFAPEACVVQVVPEEMSEPAIYAHERGHCLGFAHNTVDKDSTMMPHDLRKGKGIDKKTTNTLRYLLSKLPF